MSQKPLTDSSFWNSRFVAPRFRFCIIHRSMGWGALFWNSERYTSCAQPIYDWTRTAHEHDVIDGVGEPCGEPPEPLLVTRTKIKNPSEYPCFPTNKHMFWAVAAEVFLQMPIKWSPSWLVLEASSGYLRFSTAKELGQKADWEWPSMALSSHLVHKLTFQNASTLLFIPIGIH